MKIFKFIACFYLLSILSADRGLSQDYDKKEFYREVSTAIGYDINGHDEKYVLEKDLKEISGLSFYKKNQLACVEDEHGEVYIYDLKAKKTVQTIKFGKKGDYEGIEIIGHEVFVLRSDGEIFKFSMQNGDEVEADSWETPLSSKDDVEGLGYSRKGKELLLACKEESKVDGEKSKGKAIYCFDTKTNLLQSNPFADIKAESLNDFLESKTTAFKKIKEFKPSGIATHPKTHQIFVIASVGKLLVILDKEGELEEVIPLDGDVHRQPEGICFAPDGTMFISNEGKGGRGYILAFSYR